MSSSQRGHGVVYLAAEFPLPALSKGATLMHVTPTRFDASRHGSLMLVPASRQLYPLLASAFI
jgi:hypothetical protein